MNTGAAEASKSKASKSVWMGTYQCPCTRL